MAQTKRKPFTDEQKAEALRIIEQVDKPLSQVAQYGEVREDDLRKIPDALLFFMNLKNVKYLNNCFNSNKIIIECDLKRNS